MARIILLAKQRYMTRLLQEQAFLCLLEVCENFLLRDDIPANGGSRMHSRGAVHGSEVCPAGKIE